MMNRIQQLSLTEPVLEPIRTVKLKLVKPVRMLANQDEMESKGVQKVVQTPICKEGRKCEELIQNATQIIAGSNTSLTEKTNSNLSATKEKLPDVVEQNVDEKATSSHINQMKQSVQCGSTEGNKSASSPIQHSQSEVILHDSCRNIKFEQPSIKALNQSSVNRRVESKADIAGSDIGTNTEEVNYAEKDASTHSIKRFQKNQELTENEEQKILESHEVISVETTNHNMLIKDKTSLNTVNQKGVESKQATPSSQGNSLSQINTVSSGTEYACFKSEHLSQTKKPFQNGYTENKKSGDEQREHSETLDSSSQNVNIKKFINDFSCQSAVKTIKSNAYVVGSEEKTMRYSDARIMKEKFQMEQALHQSTAGSIIKEHTDNIKPKEPIQNHTTLENSTQTHLTRLAEKNQHPLMIAGSQKTTRNHDEIAAENFSKFVTSLDRLRQNVKIISSDNSSKQSSVATNKMENNACASGIQKGEQYRHEMDKMLPDCVVEMKQQCQSAMYETARECTQTAKHKQHIQDQASENLIQTNLMKSQTTESYQIPSLTSKTVNVLGKHIGSALSKDNEISTTTLSTTLTEKSEHKQGTTFYRHSFVTGKPTTQNEKPRSFENTTSSSGEKVNFQGPLKVDTTQHDHYARSAQNIVDTNRSALKVDKTPDLVKNETSCSFARTTFYKATTDKLTPIRSESKPLQAHGTSNKGDNIYYYNPTQLHSFSSRMWDEDRATVYSRPVSTYDAAVNCVPSLLPLFRRNFRSVAAPPVEREAMNAIVNRRIGFFEPEPHSIGREMLIYCLKCKGKTDTKNSYRTVTVKGQPIIKGYCVRCDRKKCSFSKRS